MNPLASFLDRFRSLKPPQASLKKAVVRALSEVMQVEIPPEKVRLSQGAAFLDVDPLIKSEVFLKKAELLRRVRELLETGDRPLGDIR
jgi:hypothetical protein